VTIPWPQALSIQKWIGGDRNSLRLPQVKVKVASKVPLAHPQNIRKPPKPLILVGGMGLECVDTAAFRLLD